MLRLEKIRLAYEDQTILEKISLDVATEELITLIGPSGTGKSSLIRGVMGLVPLAEGQVLLNHEPISTKKHALGWIPQNYGLLPWQSVEVNIMTGIRLKHQNWTHSRQQLFDHLVETLDLERVLKKYPNQLSGGQQQRVSIARALLLDPDALFLDEPFSALDALTREKIQLLFLTQWSERPVPTVMITHDVEEAVYLGHRIVLLSGQPATIKKVWQNPCVNYLPEERREHAAFYPLVQSIREELRQG